MPLATALLCPSFQSQVQFAGFVCPSCLCRFWTQAKAPEALKIGLKWCVAAWRYPFICPMLSNYLWTSNGVYSGDCMQQCNAERLCGRIKYFFEKYRLILVMLYAVCWTLLFFRHSFDFNERFFRIPLLVLSIPLFLSLNRAHVLAYLRQAPQVYFVLMMILAACIAGAFCPFPDARSYLFIVFGWFVLTLSGFCMKLALPDAALRLMLSGLIAGLVVTAGWVALGATGVDAFIHGRLALLTGYPATLGLMAGVALTGQFFFWRHGRHIIAKKVDVGLFAVLFTILLLSQARAAFGAFAVSAGFIIIAASGRPLRKLALISLGGAAFIGMAFLLGQIEPLKSSRVYQRAVSVISHPLADASITGRMAIWEAAAGSVAERPLTGYGMRMFPHVYSAYMEKNGDVLKAKYAFVEPVGGHAHNLVLGSLTEFGVLGFLPLLCIYIYAFLPRKVHPGSDTRCLQALFLFFFAHGLVEYMLNNIIYSDLFFASVGLFAGAMYFEWRAEKEGGVTAQVASSR